MSINRLALVGVGHWGQNLLRNFVSLLGEERVIACDSDASRLEAARTSFPGVALSSSSAELLQDDAVDAVAIAAPAATHFELARQVLAAGKHAFVEKPLALRTDEAKELIALADKQERVLMVDHLLEYHPAVDKLKSMIEAGELGQVFHMHSERLNFGVVRTEENALWSLGPHDISVILYLLDEEPLRVRAWGACHLQDGIEDVVHVDLEFPRNIMAHLDLSWLHPDKTRKLVVVGSERMAVFDDLASEKLVLFKKRVVPSGKTFALQDEGRRPLELGAAFEEPLRAVCRHFLDCVERGLRPRSDGHDGLRVLRVLSAAGRSLDTDGEWVEVKTGVPR